MKINLKNKKILVTGATSGIGFSIAERLLSAGGIVYINGRSQEKIDIAIKKLGGNNLLPALGDVGNIEGIENITKATKNEIDILVNNAGIFYPKDLVDLTDEDWLEIYEFNVLSVIRLTQKFLPYMKKNNWGRIISIASESAMQIPGEMIHYGVSKAAMVAFTRGLAVDLAGTNITANSILPGPTHTAGVEDYVKNLYKNDLKAKGLEFSDLEKRFMNEHRPGMLIGRFIKPEEVANFVAYIASDLSSATTGASLRVEGGIIPTV